MLNLDEEDLPKSSLSVVLIGVASDNSEVSDDKITLGLTAKEYIDNQNHNLSFELYHYPEDAHLLPISSKVSRGTSLYITGNLSIIGDLLLVKITQINFIESTSSSASYKVSNYPWEKKQINSPSSSTSSAANIAKSLSEKTKKRGKQTSPLSRSQKIPKLSSLSLSQSNMDNNNFPNETTSSLQPNVDNDDHDKNQYDTPDDVVEQESETLQRQRAKPRRGRKKK